MQAALFSEAKVICSHQDSATRPYFKDNFHLDFKVFQDKKHSLETIAEFAAIETQKKKTLQTVISATNYNADVIHTTYFEA